MCWMVCQGWLVSLFVFPMPVQKVLPRLLDPVCSVCHQNCLGSHLGIWASPESFFCASQVSALLTSGESHTIPQSGRNKFIFYLFSSSLLIGKTDAFLLSEPCLRLLSSIFSLPREKKCILFICSISSVGRILTWVSSCWCRIASLGVSVNLTHVMYSGLVGISGPG